MIVNCVYVHVKKDAILKFIEATVANHTQSVKEVENLRFDLIQQEDDPERFMIYEAYESENGAADHKKTPHYLKWRDEVAEMMAEPRNGVRYEIIAPNNKSLW